jgi:hypothetical protein
MVIADASTEYMVKVAEGNIKYRKSIPYYRIIDSDGNETFGTTDPDIFMNNCPNALTVVLDDDPIVVDENGDVVKSIPLSDKAFMNELFTKSLPCPASIVSKSNQTINVLIVGVSNDNVNYVEKKIYNANKESIYFKKASKSIPIVNIDNIYFHKE